jgi:Zn-dependent membrane protease YugP
MKSMYQYFVNVYLPENQDAICNAVASMSFISLCFILLGGICQSTMLVVAGSIIISLVVFGLLVVSPVIKFFTSFQNWNNQKE